MSESTITARGMRAGAGLSRNPDTAAAARDACLRALEPLDGAKTHLLAVFATPDHWSAAEEMVAVIAGIASPDRMIGSMAEAVIAEGQEVEHGPGIAIFAAHLPGAIIATAHVRAVAGPAGVRLGGNMAFLETVRTHSPLIVLSDPFTFPAERLLADLNAAGRTAIGGLSSGGRGPGEHRLIVDGRIVDGGAVVTAIGGIGAIPVISTGCSPIGPDMVITDADGALVRTLAGAPAASRLAEAIASLSPTRRELAKDGILAGLVVDENVADYQAGDYLMRGVLGADHTTGEIIIGDRVRVGQTLRFHVRDAESASEDLRRSLAMAGGVLHEPVGGLIFACNGRGQAAFGEADHDARMVISEFGDIPMVGMFCNGEVGPVAGSNFLHSFSVALTLFDRS